MFGINMKKIAVLYYLISFSIQGHFPPPVGVDQFALNVSHGGYGYYHRSSSDIYSESGANALMNFSCTQAEKEKNKRIEEILDEECDPFGLGLRNLEKSVNSIESKINENIFEKLRQKTVEYFALNLAEATKNSSRPFIPRSLLTKCSIPADSFMARGINSRRNSQTSRRWRDLKGVVGRSFDPVNMGMAIIARERLLMFSGRRPKIGKTDRYPSQANVTKEQFYQTIGYNSRTGDIDKNQVRKAKDCHVAYELNNGDYGGRHQALEERDNYNFCVGIDNELHRIETNYPNLYRWTSRQSSQYNFGGSSTRESRYVFDHYKYINNNGGKVFQPGIYTGMKELITANGGSWQSLWNSVKKRGLTKPLESAFLSAVRKAKNPSKTTPALTRAWNKYKSIIKNTNESYAGLEKTTLFMDFCRKPKSERARRSFLKKILRLRPNVIRQFMIDEKPENRVFAKALFCKNGYQKQIKEKTPCAGVSGGPLPGKNPVVVKQHSTGTYPFRIYTGISISQRTSRSPRKISLGLNIAIGPNLQSDPNSSTLVSQASSRFESDSSKYLNCQVGADGTPQSYTPPSPTSMPASARKFFCPEDPKLKKPPGMKFDIKFNVFPPGAVAPLPKITMHRCFRAEISWKSGIADASNCQKVRQFSINQCIAKGGSPSACNSVVPPVGHPSLNRVDATNLTLSTKLSTVRHEVLHNLGLKDEYIDTQIPFNPIGEIDSIMRKSSNPRAILFPRHLDEIIAPSKCSKLRINALKRRVKRLRRGSR
jgi:hypothetical protein